ncbi:hypothetical protein TNCV_1088061 [Trichonephila clavipes]|uniref:Uncharacterized protein n=1 Tax=Trichonephila clavipes TaxID=2585209 RepID=A0A8X6VQY7_TRICX|nr:hypothetical protein TNCV_1088061 [Trichonephila clavipes]
MLPVLGKKAVLEWCMKEGLIGSSYVCPKCGKSMELRERTVRRPIGGYQSPQEIWRRPVPSLEGGILALTM